jgi:hypothetical protein
MRNHKKAAGNAVVVKMMGRGGWTSKQETQVEVGHARPQIVGATLAPAIPASKDGASAQSRLYLQI